MGRRSEWTRTRAPSPRRRCELGRVFGIKEFPNDPGGHRALLEWARHYGKPRAIGVEGSGSYGAGLCRTLSSAGEQVREVPATLTVQGASAQGITRQVRRCRCRGDRPDHGPR